jgi:hypothetical protein
MPKKVHGRQAKQRPRARRATQSTATVDRTDTTGQQATVAAVPAATAATTSSPVRASGPRPGAARRAPTLTVNYAYLRHDVMMLSILGPAMIVLLIIAYLIFHGA